MKRTERTSRILGGALAVALAVGLAPGVRAGTVGPRPGTTKPSKALPKHPTLGPANAKVTIEVYGDFQCPFTRRLAPTLPKLAKLYPKKVRILWRDFPLRFHRRAMPAAIAAREVYRQKGVVAFSLMVTRIFTYQRSLTDANLVKWAGQAGADKGKVRQALLSNRYRAAILKEMKAAKARGVRGTPTILINGTPHKGSRTVAAFKRVIDAL